MSSLTKGLILVVAVIAIAAGLVVWRSTVGHTKQSFNSISKEEIELLLADVAKTNPAILKRLAQDPKMKQEQIENLKQLLAFASQAKKDGLTEEVNNKQELDSIRAEIVAVNYDKQLNKDKAPASAFSLITDEQVKAYWDEDAQGPPAKGILERIGLGEPTETRTHEQEFNDFLAAKLEIMKATNPGMSETLTDEEKEQAREIFAKIRIYEKEYDDKLNAGTLDKEFVKKAELQVKLQQAQFLARLYSEKLQDQLKVTPEEVDKYIADHPEISPVEKRKKAEEILARAKNGEDFVALANEFSEDPGNKGPDGATPQGGIYKDVPKGRMVPPFEAAALALEPGQVAPQLIETDFGFHIVKLERALGPGSKNAAKPAADDDDEETASGETYDVRHILISTGIKDEENPMGRDTPVKEYVQKKLEAEKEKKILEDIVAKNNVSVPADFTVPEVTEEQMQQMRQRQQPMPPQMQPDPEMDDAEDAPPPDAKKPEPKKK